MPYKRPVYVLNCRHCSISFERKYSDKKKPVNFDNVFCSKDCRYALPEYSTVEWTEERKKAQSLRYSGSGNPRYGVEWSQNQKDKLSVAQKKNFECIEARYKAGASNRGVKFSKERIEKMHGHRTPESYSRPVSEELKRHFSKTSSERFTPEYKAQQRKIMEERGLWIPLSIKDPYELFYKECNWVDSMVDFLLEENKIKFKDKGYYSSKKNKNGYVRDHIFGRRWAWDLNVNPKLVRHPVNLALITHSSNISKGHSEKKATQEEKELALNQLYDKIRSYTGDWYEHKDCIAILDKLKL